MTFMDIFLHLQSTVMGQCGTHPQSPKNVKQKSSSDPSRDCNFSAPTKQKSAAGSDLKMQVSTEVTENTLQYENASHAIFSIECIQSHREFTCCTIKCGDFKLQAHPTAFKNVRIPVIDPDNSTICVYFDGKLGPKMACYIPATELDRRRGPLQLALSIDPNDKGQLMPAEAKKRFIESLNIVSDNIANSSNEVVDGVIGTTPAPIETIEIDFDPRFQGLFTIQNGAGQVYIPDASDMIDVRVADILNENPPLMHTLSITRQSKGQYTICNREVRVTLGYEFKCSKPLVSVTDGPLRQPFLQYMRSSDKEMEFEPVAVSNKVFDIPTHQRLSWKANATLDRIQAMKLATKEAKARDDLAAKQAGTAVSRRGSSSSETSAASTATSPLFPQGSGGSVYGKGPLAFSGHYSTSQNQQAYQNQHSQYHSLPHSYQNRMPR
eukprot:Platyproteum_vivax@DN3327_c0_g1_i1.p1